MRIGLEELREVLTLWNLSETEIQAVLEVLSENESERNGAWLFRYYGPHRSKASELEELFKQLSGAEHAVAVNSGTSALVAALVAAGIGPGDEVIVPAYTFIATAAAVVAAGAVPVIAEIDSTMTLDSHDVAKKLTARTRAILPVSMRGMPCDVDALRKVALEHGLIVIEDVAQACGTTVQGKWSGTFGTLGCFSFGQYKIVAAGEGGMVVTDDDYLAMRVRSYHDTAACWRPDRYAVERKPGELFAGQNFRINEMSAAVALAQLRKLPDYLESRRSFRSNLVNELTDIKPVEVAPSADPLGDAGIALCLQTPDPGWAEEITSELKSFGVPAGGRHDQGLRDWHVYRFWEYILDKKTPHRSGFPYSQIPSDEHPNYTATSCRRSLDLLERSLFVRLSELDGQLTHSDLADLVRSAIEKARKGRVVA